MTPRPRSAPLGPLQLVLALLALAAWTVYLTLFRLPEVRLRYRLDARDVDATRCTDCRFARALARKSLRIFTPLGALPAAVPAAVVAAEDQRFYRHGGVDWAQVWHSLRRDLRSGRYESGASTITMQLARTLFLSREKRLVRKLREVAYALALERHWSKAQILEAYLNEVDFGRHLRGVGAAACYYLGRPATQLSAEDAALLASLLPNPDERAVRAVRSPCARDR